MLHLEGHRAEERGGRLKDVDKDDGVNEVVGFGRRQIRTKRNSGIKCCNVEIHSARKRGNT